MDGLIKLTTELLAMKEQEVKVCLFVEYLFVVEPNL